VFPVQGGQSESLFDAAEESAAQAAAPLAVRMRPRTLDEVIGQRHLTRDGSPLRKLADTDAGLSVILWGPPGTGKTTLAYVVSQVTRRRFVELSAVSAGVKDVRAAVQAARRDLGLTGVQTVLFIDEVHRFNKAQQDALLPAVENRWVSFIGATTENPSFSVVGPLLSRSLLLTLQPLSDDDLRAVIDRALADPRGLGGSVSLAPGVTEQLIRVAGGDARRVLTYLEAAALGVPDGTEISLEDLERAVDQAMVRYDRAGDQHYDVISAFIKSIRGSDADAALHYLARMIEAGEDPRFIARRLIVHASEDIGLADPTALQAAVAAAQAVEFVGLPEARINLAQAVIHLSLAPKSNAVIAAIGAASADVKAGLAGPVPAHLRDAHYPGAQRLGHGQGYSYPHDDPAGVVTQQYAPDAIDGRAYYRPTRHGAEARYAERSDRIREILRPGRNGSLPPEPAAEAGAAAGEAGKSAAARGGGISADAGAPAADAPAAGADGGPGGEVGPGEAGAAPAGLTDSSSGGAASGGAASGGAASGGAASGGAASGGAASGGAASGGAASGGAASGEAGEA
jgi:putative ATPase